MKEIRIDSNKSCTKVHLNCSSAGDFLNAKIEKETKRATERENDLESQIIAGDKVADVTVDGSSVVSDKVAKIDLQPIRDSISSEEARAKAAEQRISDNYVKKSGDTMTGDLTVDGTITATTFVGSLSGNASSATTATGALGLKSLNDSRPSDLNALTWTTESGHGYAQFVTGIKDTAANNPSGYDGELIHLGWDTTYAWGTEIFASQGSHELYIRYNKDGVAGNWSDWARLATTAELSSYLPLSGGTMTGTLNVPTINNYNVSTAVSIATGTHADSYFQSQKFRGQGNAGTYNHAIDFGYAGHDRVDFYEYGGIWNFWMNNQSTAVTDKATKLALTIGLNSLSNKSYTYTWPNKTGTFALTSDIKDTTYSIDTAAGNTLTLTGSDGTSLTKTINDVSHASSADSATNATNDGNGNVISSTYATVSALSTVEGKIAKISWRQW